MRALRPRAGPLPVHGFPCQPDLWTGDLRLPVVPGAPYAPHGQRPGERAGPVGLRPGGAGEPGAPCEGGPRGRERPGGRLYREPYPGGVPRHLGPEPGFPAGVAVERYAHRHPAQRAGGPGPAGVLQPVAAPFVLWQVWRTEIRGRVLYRGAHPDGVRASSGIGRGLAVPIRQRAVEDGEHHPYPLLGTGPGVCGGHQAPAPGGQGRRERRFGILQAGTKSFRTYRRLRPRQGGHRPNLWGPWAGKPISPAGENPGPGQTGRGRGGLSHKGHRPPHGGSRNVL